MNKKALIISIVAVLISFIAGFILANALNRRVIEDLQGEIGRLQKASPTDQESSEGMLSDEEIQQKVTEADASPDNIEFQKSLALALYRYSTMKQEPKWLPDVARLLTRAFDKNPKDFNAAVSLGNIYFDIAQTGQTNENYLKSREFYEKALAIKPDEIETRTDLGLTYLMATPPQPEKAVVEFQKSLKLNPKHEKTLQNMIQAEIGLGKLQDAENLLNRLKEVNAGNEAIEELNTKLTEARAKTEKEMKWILLLIILLLVVIFLFVRYRRHITMGIQLLKMFRMMRQAGKPQTVNTKNVNSSKKRDNLKSENLNDVNLVRCERCGKWVTPDSALKLRSGKYCSSACMERAAKLQSMVD